MNHGLQNIYTVVYFRKQIFRSILERFHLFWKGKQSFYSQCLHSLCIEKHILKSWSILFRIFAVHVVSLLDPGKWLCNAYFNITNASCCVSIANKFPFVWTNWQLIAYRYDESLWKRYFNIIMQNLDIKTWSIAEIKTNRFCFFITNQFRTYLMS